MWVKLTSGQFVGRYLNLNNFTEVYTGVVGVRYRVFGATSASGSGLYLTDTFTTSVEAEHALACILAGISPPVP